MLAARGFYHLPIFIHEIKSPDVKDYFSHLFSLLISVAEWNSVICFTWSGTTGFRETYLHITFAVGNQANNYYGCNRKLNANVYQIERHVHVGI